jgi:hypothetical protein
LPSIATSPYILPTSLEEDAVVEVLPIQNTAVPVNESYVQEESVGIPDVPVPDITTSNR